MSRRDDRSAEAQEFRRWYGRKAWKVLRSAQLLKAPLCAFCEASGRTVAATVVDHIKPHRGDVDLFHDPANLQSLCDQAPWYCHSRVKQRIETGADAGYSSAAGLDGWPLDPNHPANR